MVFLAVFVLASIGMNVLAAQGLKHRRNAMLIYFNAALTCTGFPFGALLGGLTFEGTSRPIAIAGRSASMKYCNRSGGANPLFDWGSRVGANHQAITSSCLLYTSPSPRDRTRSRMPSSA